MTGIKTIYVPMKYAPTPHLLNGQKKNPDDELAIVYIPDNATAYYIEEYDGHETVHALINNKFVELEPWENEEE